ncbi:30S ribosome-binding factor RbfA [Thermodesulfobacteriota bacterium]
MGRFRKTRVAELIREVISDIIRLKIKDPRVEGVTITEVLMAADLKSARIYFGSLGDGKNDVHKQGLEAAEQYIRRQMRSELDLKYIPQLTFFYDSAFDHFDRIDKILKGLNEPED